MQFLGLGKTKYNSSICLLDDTHHEAPIELVLTERLNRSKNSGAWPEVGLMAIRSKLKMEDLEIAENRDLISPSTIEETQNQFFPFYDYLQKKNLIEFTSHSNPCIQNISHHLAHAYAALALSPFEKSVIIVMDGAGSERGERQYEECTVFLQNGAVLTPVFEQTISFKSSAKIPGHTFGNRVGSSYEKASEFIFNSPNSSGKVMGLAPFGNSFQFTDLVEFQENWPWDQSFKGKTKKEWEGVNHLLFKNIAATVQEELEHQYDIIIAIIKEKYSEYENLILTGGCALNCTNNARILYQNVFRQIFIPPFPGDESIAFGLAHYLKFKKNPQTFKVTPFESQSAYWGPMASLASDALIEQAFSSDLYERQKCQDIVGVTAKLLLDNHVVAWFQGRSESGPRALGNRSLLARPDQLGLKDYLNLNIKGRESFRPYGCSVLHSKAHLYFDVDVGFDNPYMSYAIRVRAPFQEMLKEVSHVDGTSRMQTVRVGQNERFHQLLECFGDQSGIYCLLNTSLNVMDEPILETVSDARRFMDKTPIDYIVIDQYLIKRRI